MNESCQHDWIISHKNVKTEVCDENPVQTMNIKMKVEICDNDEHVETTTIVKSELCEMCDNEEGTIYSRTVGSELYAIDRSEGNPTNSTKSEMWDNDENATADINMQNEVHAE